MNVLEGIEAFKDGLMWICLSALAAIAVGVVGAWLCRSARSVVAWAWRSRSWFEKGVLIGLLSFCVVFGSEKTRSGGGALGDRALPSVGADHRAARTGNGALGDRALPGVPAEEIAQGWRLESVVTNDAVSYAMPTNGVEYMPWSLGGGYEMHFPLDVGDFAFPFGTGMVHRLDVLSGGMVESLPRQRVEGQYSSAMSICAAREWASIVPGVGRFWWADAARSASGPYQAKLLTWENVYAGRDRTGQYNAQIEFHDDGNFITRSNNVERVYRRVLTFDLDNDGLPNDIDPAPEVPLVPSAWNQSEEWAAAAFPSNAAEIAAMGGYAAWAAARGAEPDRRLVSLGLAFDDGSVRPSLFDFCGVPVVADGAAELVFAIDCGAKVPFSLTSGRLGSLAVTATEPPTRSGEGMTTIDSSVIQNIFTVPHERTVGDVKLHLDNFRSGWLCRTANVSIDGDEVQHLFPGDTIGVAASVTGCHTDAYLGCTWHGGEGITFSNSHSLTTDVTYASASTVVWATNGIDLVTQFFGYTLTNHVPVTVGTDAEPPLALALVCQDVFFLNDAELGSPSNRAERIRPVTLNLTGPAGTNGTVRLSTEGDVAPVLFHVVDGVTNRVTSETVFPLAVTDGFAHTGSCTIYVSCPNRGTGTITATFTPAGGGEPLTSSATFRCIEPLRKLVTAEKFGGRYVNPSRLVMGTNAVLKVGANGAFSPLEVDWRVVSGPGRIVATYGWYATVEPTGMGTVTVEARFNEDEIQPRFVLPVVLPRTIPVRAFVVEPPYNQKRYGWTNAKIDRMLDAANEIFTQVGIRFELVTAPESVGSTNDWNLLRAVPITNASGRVTWLNTPQFTSLVSNHTAHDCIKMYFLGSLKREDGITARKTSSGIIFTKKAGGTTIAHELGHVLGLDDCYWFYKSKGRPAVYMPYADATVDHAFFMFSENDWGQESGRGFYEKSDTRRSVMSKMLMHGFNMGTRADVPNNLVFSLRGKATSPQQTTYPRVGADYIVQHNLEVYSR